MFLVVFSSHNGANSLPRMLEAMRALESPPGGYRIVAVDNASTDNTREVLHRFRDLLPLTILEERRRGKNYALNRALDHLGAATTQADLVIFTDDDILPEPDWLQAYHGGLLRHPEASLFGGAITPVFPTDLPTAIAHLEPEFGLLFAATNLGSGPCRARDIWGPNMAVRGSILGPRVRFDPTIGPNGTEQYAMGSEVDFTQRLERLGHRSAFIAEARVGHIVHDFQLDPAWAMRRAFRGGRGFARRGFSPRHSQRIAGIPVRLAVNFSRAAFDTAVARLTLSERRERLAAFRWAFLEGALTEAISLERARRSAAAMQSAQTVPQRRTTDIPREP